MKEDIEQAADTAKQKTLEERFPTLNIQMGMTYCMNDESFFLEMIETYIQGDKREVLAKEYAEESWKNYQTHMHALKSTSLTVGAVHLSEAAKVLEEAAKENDVEYIQSNHSFFQYLNAFVSLHHIIVWLHFLFVLH